MQDRTHIRKILSLKEISSDPKKIFMELIGQEHYKVPNFLVISKE